MGLTAASPMGSLREATSAIRGLLAGAELSRQGEYFRFERVRLGHPPRSPIPMYLGVHGPASLRLSGELADGTLLGWFSSPSYVSWARDRIDEGRARAGRDDPHELVALCVCAISDEDPDGAREAVGAWAWPMLAGMVDSPQLTTSPLRAELIALRERGTEGSSQGMRRLLDELVAAGTTAECQVMVDRLLDAGADRVVLVPNPAGLRSTAAMVEQMRRATGLAGS